MDNLWWCSFKLFFTIYLSYMELSMCQSSPLLFLHDLYIHTSHWIWHEFLFFFVTFYSINQISSMNIFEFKCELEFFKNFKIRKHIWKHFGAQPKMELKRFIYCLSIDDGIFKVLVIVYRIVILAFFDNYNWYCPCFDLPK